MIQIDRKALLRDAPIDEKDIRLYQKPGEDFEGFGFIFESFDDVARFFTGLGVSAGHNEHTNVLSEHLMFADDANELANLAQCEYSSDIGYEVYFPGCELV